MTPPAGRSRGSRAGRPALLATGAAAAAAALAWRRVAALRVEVVGPSMLPALAPGERLLVLRTRTLRDGELVVVRDPHAPGRVLVKRVASVGAGGLVVVGDNAGASRDSRHFGPVAASDVLGRPWYRYSPEGSRGRLARRPR